MSAGQVLRTGGSWLGTERRSFISHASPGSGGPFKAPSTLYPHTLDLAKDPDGRCICDTPLNPLSLEKAGVGRKVGLPSPMLPSILFLSAPGSWSRGLSVLLTPAPDLCFGASSVDGEL